MKGLYRVGRHTTEYGLWGRYKTTTSSCRHAASFNVTERLRLCIKNCKKRKLLNSKLKKPVEVLMRPGNSFFPVKIRIKNRLAPRKHYDPYITSRKKVIVEKRGGGLPVFRGIRRFINILTRTLQTTPSHPVSSRSILILSSHTCPRLHTFRRNLGVSNAIFYAFDKI